MTLASAVTEQDRRPSDEAATDGRRVAGPAPTAIQVPRWTLRTEPGQDAVETPVPADLAAAVVALARELRVHPAAVWLAAHSHVLQALSGEDEVTTGCVDAAGTWPCHLAAAPTWRTLVRQAHAVVAARGGRSSAADGPPAAGATAFEVILDLVRGGDPQRGTVLGVKVPQLPGEVLRVSFRRDVLDADAARRIAGYHIAALHHLLMDVDADPADADLLADAERRFQLEQLAGPRRARPPRPFHALFEDAVRRHPDRVAAVQDSQELTYGELNARANRLAHALLARGLQSEELVAVVTERNLGWMAAVIAVLKAGGAYLPIEPHFPADRIARTLSRAGCRLVVTEDGSTTTLDDALAGLPGVRRLLVTEVEAEERPGSDPGIPVSLTQLAYVYFTSGSTGEPKGAMCEHAGMVNHLFAKIDDLGIGPHDVVAQTAPQCFDISLWQLVSALVVGGRTLIVGQDRILDVERFVDALEEGGVAVAQLVPSYLDAVVAYLDRRPRPLPDLRCVSATGEALKAELVRRWFAVMPGVALVNAYGLTETSDDTNHEVMHAPPAGDRIPLGPPVPNVRVYLLDDRQRLVPLGAPGEIAFSGVCVGRGYVNDPERTAQAYSFDPFHPGERLYRAGDYGRWLPDGKLEYLGRRDSQVKISGFRIEIGEIENALLRVPGVRDGAVVVAERPERGKHLVAFYQAPRALDGAALRDLLARSLPGYMVPQVWHWQRLLPLTPNGKVDRKRLAALAAQLESPGETVDAPRTETERWLASAWARVLAVPVDAIDRRDHFFDRGGNSLSAVKLAIALDRAVSLKDLLAHPVLAHLAQLLDARAASGCSPTAAARPDLPSLSPEGTTMSTSTVSELAVDPREGAPPTVLVDPGKDPLAWVHEHRVALRGTIARHGAVLVRGLGMRDVREASTIFQALGSELMTEREAFAARTAHAPGVYSSATWPANQPMCMHHELSYALHVPALMLFACLTEPAAGGVTGVADSQEVLRKLPADLLARFEREGWMLLRSYTGEIGASVADAFGTDDREGVERYCRANRIELEWQPDGTLRTRQRRPAVVRHPVTAERCWFNQVAFLSEWTMEPEVREFLVDMYGEDGLPFTTAFGNGDPVGEDVVALLNDIYEAHTLREPWRAGDLMLVDNVRMAHSREPYEGPREVLVAMSDPVSLQGADSRSVES